MRRADEELRSLGARKLADVLRLGGFTNTEVQHGRATSRITPHVGEDKE